jgi:hypothetical protein
MFESLAVAPLVNLFFSLSLCFSSNEYVYGVGRDAIGFVYLYIDFTQLKNLRNRFGCRSPITDACIVYRKAAVRFLATLSDSYAVMVRTSAMSAA